MYSQVQRSSQFAQLWASDQTSRDWHQSFTLHLSTTPFTIIIIHVEQKIIGWSNDDLDFQVVKLIICDLVRESDNQLNGLKPFQL